MDGTAIRKKIKKEYEKALRDLDNSRPVVSTNSTKMDQPQFSRWLNSHFGVRSRNSGELNLKMAADDAIVFMVQNEVMFGLWCWTPGVDKRVMDLKENPEPPPSPPGGDRDGKRERFGAGPDWEMLAGRRSAKSHFRGDVRRNRPR